MVRQAEVNTNGANGKTKAAPPNVAASFNDLAHDAIELAELQTRLLKLDAQAAAREGGVSLVLVIAGVCLLLGCVPIALAALAELFVAQFDWSRTIAFAAAAGVGLGLSAIIGTAAWYEVRSALSSLKRSRDELNRNLAWIKSNLKRGKSRSYTDHSEQH
jgi:hypothetical protein